MSYIGNTAETTNNIKVQRFNGNGSNTTFPLNMIPASENNTQVFVNGVYQQKNTYSVVGSSLIFATAPASGTENIEISTVSVLPLGTNIAEQVTYDSTTVKEVIDRSLPIADYTALRAYTGRATSVRITTPGIAGFFTRDSDVVTADNGGTVIVDASGRRWKRVFDGAVNVKWFGAVGDGVADDTVSLTKFFQAIQNGKGLLDAKTYYIASRITSAFSNVNLVGAPGKTKITSDYSNPSNPEQAGFIRLLDIDNLHVSGIEFESTLASADLDTGSALVFSYQNNVKNSSFRKCKFTAPSTNTSGLSFYTRITALDTAHTIDGLWVEDNDFEDLGAIGCTIMNRSTNPEAAQRVYFNRNKGKNMGLSGSYGFLVSFDGCGQHFSCDDNLVENALVIGIENTNWVNGSFKNNRFGDFSRVYAPMSFSGTSSGLLIEGNRTLEAASGRSNFIGVSDSVFRGNYFEAAGDYAFHTRKSSRNRFFGDVYKSSGIYAALLGFGSDATADNLWLGCRFDNGAATGVGVVVANTATVMFSGSLTTRNRIVDSAIIKGSGGTLTDQSDGALGNSVDSYQTDASTFASNHFQISMTDANYTFAGRDQIVRYRAFRANGTLTTGRVVNFPPASVLTLFTFWNNTNHPLTLTPSGGNGPVVYPGQKVTVVSNGTNLEGHGAFASAWNDSILALGVYRLWVDSTGVLRIKSGAPTSDTDGTVVGAQT